MSNAFTVGIIGGGPAGAAAGRYLASAGVAVELVEKEDFPRYCVGESLLPYNLEIFRDLGLEERIRAEGFMRKDGAVFGEATSEQLMRIRFADGLEEGHDHAYQVPRERFDTLLLEAAVEAGVRRRRGTVTTLVEADGEVRGFAGSAADGTPFRVDCDLVLDCSGRLGFIGRKKRLFAPGPELDTAAVFGLFAGVEMPADAAPGDIAILAYDRGWFWLIPFADGRISVGSVVDRELLEGYGGKDAEAALRRLAARAGGLVERAVANATPVRPCGILNRFNRRASSFAGPGWVLVGDAAMFVDPVFSAGVLVATAEARLAARAILAALAAGRRPESADFNAYAGVVDSAYEVFSRYIFGWRDPVFREVFCSSDPDPRIKRTVTTILAGGVLDRDHKARGDRAVLAAGERRRRPHAGG